MAGDLDVGGQGDGVRYGFGTAAVFAHKGHGGCEDCTASLAGLDGAGCEGAAGADVFDCVDVKGVFCKV